MSLSYDPNDLADDSSGSSSGQRTYLAGDYKFYIEEAVEKTFSTGSKGLSMQLAAVMPSGDAVKVFDNCVYTPKALWKLKSMLECIGCDFAKPPSPHELVGRTGYAHFAPDDRGYLRPKTYLATASDHPAHLPHPAARSAPRQESLANVEAALRAQPKKTWAQLQADDVPF